MKEKNTKLAIVGLGYVGLPLAVEFSKHYKVVGYDKNIQRINELKKGVDRTKEVEGGDLSNLKCIKFTDNHHDLKECDIVIITVPTPVDEVNRPDLQPLIDASQKVGEVIKKGAIVVYESTVYPGCTEEVCVPVLEAASGFKFNQEFFCGYSPERINPGDKLNRLTTIKKITSGSTKVVAQIIDELYASIINAGTWRASSIRVAEAAKVIENGQRDLNIAFVNELALIFHRLGIDTLEVLEAAGSKWNFMPFRPGMVGGHCIGVDPYYLTHKAEQVGYNPQVILAGRRINDNMARYVARSVVRMMVNKGLNVNGSTVGVFGFTFKENCPDVRNSKIKDLIDELNNWSINVKIFDPFASPLDVAREYGIQLTEFSKMSELDSIIVAVGHEQFRSISPSDYRRRCRQITPVFADVKSIYDRNELERQGFSVFRL